MNTFLGRDAVFWSGIEALAVCIYTMTVIITLWLIYRQVRVAAKASQFESVRRLQELIDDFRDDRHKLFTTIPLQLALSQEQFPTRPPSRHYGLLVSEADIRRMALTKEQESMLAALTQEQLELARRVIGRLNDIGQLVEDGFMPKRFLLGKYHILLIQCCHLLEAVRRKDEKLRSGNYGQRLLRMRYWATNYNDLLPKHQELQIQITNGLEHRVIYRSPDLSRLRGMVSAIRRHFA